MKILSAATIALTLSVAPCSAELTSPTINDIWENVCAGYGLDEDRLKPAVTTAGDVLKLAVASIPLDTLKIANPNNTSGYSLAGKDGAFIVSFARTPTANGAISRSCAVSTQGVEVEDTIGFVEKKFRSEKLMEEDHGSSRVWLYRVHLLTVPDSAMVMLQYVKTMPGSDKSMLTMALVEVPKVE